MNHNLSKTNVLARQKSRPATELLLASITPEQLLEAAVQAERHQPITDPAVRELLKGVSRVGSTAAGSDQRKSYSTRLPACLYFKITLDRNIGGPGQSRHK